MLSDLIERADGPAAAAGGRPEAALAGPPMVELRNVWKAFDGVTAVRDVSLAVAAGEFLTLLGPSGCGKTTTLRMIAGFERPSRGDIRIAGESVGDRPPYLRDVNTVFQDYALFPHMTVFENIAFGLRVRRLPNDEVRRRVERMLAVIGLEGAADRRPHQLSGGQRQRVALARALVNRPKVLLLDEPLGALDLKLRKQMQTELKHLQREVNITFIYVTHDQEEALTLSDRIAVMQGGTIEQVGTPREVYERPRSAFVATFVGESNLLEGVVAGREGEDLVVRAAGLVFRCRGAEPFPPGAAVLLAIRPERIQLVRGTPPAGAVGIPGRVRELVYAGAVVRGVVDAGGQAFLVQDGARDFAAGPGEEVTLAFDPTDVTVMARG